VLNPYGATPLAAFIPIRPDHLGLGEVTRVVVTVRGNDGDSSHLTATLDPRSETFRANFAGFDQGDLSNGRSTPYSMLTEYEIDEVSMTARHAWGFGAGRPELYGSYNSGVVWNEVDDHRFMTSNGTDLDTPGVFVFNPHLVELTPEGEVVFHLEIQNTEMSAYRGGRIDPYHPALRRQMLILDR